MLIIGHRGAKASAPENTIPAFEEAIRQGADGVELDVHLTSDHQMVVCHNFHTGEVANRKRIIAKSTLKDLQTLDFGVRFGETWKGTRIPTLAQVLETVRNMQVINIELKSAAGVNKGLSWEAAKLVREMGLISRVIFSSFNHDMATATRSFLPDVEVGLLYEEPLHNPANYGLHLGAQAMHPYAQLLTKYQVESCHRHGLKVNVWTVDSAKLAAKFRRWGVDAAITNRPEALRRELRELSSQAPDNS